MLVLSRKVNQKVLIGSDIVVTVAAIEGVKVRLGIEAPKNVQILRDEILKKEYLPGELEIESASDDYAYPLGLTEAEARTQGVDGQDV